jgi:hypothetical protein
VLRLTLRSGSDGRLLARVIERDGVLFVLDFGDPAMLADASRRVLQGGFTVEWQGAVETAHPNNPALLRQLALHYATRGLLAFVDEPDWPRQAIYRPLQAGPQTLLPDEPWDAGDGERNTELRSRRELVELQDRIDSTRGSGPQLPSAVVVVDGEDLDAGGVDEDLPPDRTDDFATEEVTGLKPAPRE